MSDTPSIQIPTPGGATNAEPTSLSGTVAGLNFPVIYFHDGGVTVYGGQWSVAGAPNPGDNSDTVTGTPQTDPGVTSAPVVLTDVRPPPTVTVSQAGGNTNAATQTLSGTATTAGYGTRFTAGTTLTLSDNGVVVGHAVVASDGTWNTAVTLANQGGNLISVSDTDTIGNLGVADTFFALKSSVPAVTITGPLGTVYGSLQLIRGTATAGDVGDVVTISEDGSAIGKAAVAPDGTWALTTTVGIGAHAFQAIDADLYGNVGTSGTLIVNRAPTPPQPSITFSAGDVATRTAQQTLSGTVTNGGHLAAIAGQVLSLSDNGQPLGRAIIGNDGTWSTQVTLPRLGQNLIGASVTDAAGQLGIGGATYQYETAAHAVAIASAGGLTNQSIQRIVGTATSGDAIALIDDGVVVGSATTNADGTWWISATLTTQGANAIQAIDTSPAGNVATSGPVSYTLDTLPPAVAITSGASSTRAAGATQTVTGTAEVGSAVSVFDDGATVAGVAVAADGTWSAQVALHAGPNGISAQAIDAAGNVGFSNTVVATLDTTPVYVPAPAPVPVAPPSPEPAPAAPPAPGVTIASAGGLTNQPAFQVAGRATAGSTVSIFDGGAAVASAVAGADGSWALSLKLHEGLNIMVATDTTAAGTVGGNAIAAILDTTPPAVGFGAAPEMAGTVATLTGSASDASGIAGVEIFDGTTDLGAAQVGADGSWAFTHDFGHGLLDHLTAVATDAAGNSAAASAAYGLDTAVPGRPNLSTTTARDAGGAITSVTTRMADGTIGAQTVSNGDGNATSTGYENGQALFSIGNDVMTGTGYRENFVFQPTMGHARITDFVVAGAGHDTITLSHQDFLNIAQVLNSTTMNHGSAVIHISADDTIRLAGVTKAQLVQHRGDFAFTP